MTFYIGIDPGLGGGIAVLTGHGCVVEATRMPVTEADVLALLKPYEHAGRAVLELVHAMPKQGVVSSFTFGKGYGGLRMALAACSIPFDEVTPQRWQKAMGCRTKGDKNVSKRRAQELFPAQKVTHAIADSLLIAEYGRRQQFVIDPDLTAVSLSYLP